jgi:YbbR domain-containing protein
MQLKRKSLRNTLRRRRVLAFIVCLLIAFVFWVLIAFNNNYNTTLTVPVRYINIPENRVVAEELPKKVELTINGKGYNVLSYLMLPEQGEIIIDGKRIGIQKRNNINKGFLLTRDGVDYFNRQHADIRALNISPDTLFFQLQNRIFKRVPVKVNLDVTFAKQYGLINPVKILPDSVDISGEEEMIEGILYVDTDVFSKKEISTSFNTSLNIKPIDGIYCTPASVELNFYVEQFTEQIFDIPITIRNNNPKDSIVVLPSKVQVSFLVGLNDYIKSQADLFEVEVDFSDIGTVKKGKVQVKLSKSPDFVKNTKITPESVDYIFIKK